jgi:hypothetical protein
MGTLEASTSQGGGMSVTSTSVDTPDRTMDFEHGTARAMRAGAFTITRNTFRPGWRWSTDVRAIAGTESCQVHHIGFMLSGRLHVRSNDGGEAEINAGEAYEIEPGHDGWVVGDEPVESVEFGPAPEGG